MPYTISFTIADSGSESDSADSTNSIASAAIEFTQVTLCGITAPTVTALPLVDLSPLASVTRLYLNVENTQRDEFPPIADILRATPNLKDLQLEIACAVPPSTEQKNQSDFLQCIPRGLESFHMIIQIDGEGLEDNQASIIASSAYATFAKTIIENTSILNEIFLSSVNFERNQWPIPAGSIQSLTLIDARLTPVDLTRLSSSRHHQYTERLEHVTYFIPKSTRRLFDSPNTQRNHKQRKTESSQDLRP